MLRRGRVGQAALEDRGRHGGSDGRGDAAMSSVGVAWSLGRRSVLGWSWLVLVRSWSGLVVFCLDLFALGFGMVCFAVSRS